MCHPQGNLWAPGREPALCLRMKSGLLMCDSAPPAQAWQGQWLTPGKTRPVPSPALTGSILCGCGYHHTRRVQGLSFTPVAQWLLPSRLALGHPGPLSSLSAFSGQQTASDPTSVPGPFLLLPLDFLPFPSNSSFALELSTCDSCPFAGKWGGGLLSERPPCM